MVQELKKSVGLFWKCQMTITAKELTNLQQVILYWA